MLEYFYCSCNCTVTTMIAILIVFAFPPKSTSTPMRTWRSWIVPIRGVRAFNVSITRSNANEEILDLNRNDYCRRLRHHKYCASRPGWQLPLSRQKNCYRGNCLQLRG